MRKERKEGYQVAIIGGGVSGVTTANRLSEFNINSILFEKNESLVKGPPFCHLHAGGNLYPEISINQCLELLRQSIDIAKYYPYSIDKRPTFISVPKSESFQPFQLVNKLDAIVHEYKNLIQKNPENKILGEPDSYYQLFEKEDLDRLINLDSIANPSTMEEWMVEVSKKVNYSLLKFPVLMVEEYGWNLFRLAAQASIELEESNYCDVQLETKVLDIVDYSDSYDKFNWEIITDKGVFYAEYLLNAAGYLTGEFDNDINLEVERMVEFKAAYVSNWGYDISNLPELIFHGERGTYHGMAQLTPYADGYYQIHGMTPDITLFEQGLVGSQEHDAQPDLEDKFDEKLDEGWRLEDCLSRTKNAINYIAKFVPSFKDAEVGGPPLFGAQQIPGDDPTLRVAEISFPKKYYARSEIVKASSALDAANQLLLKLDEVGIHTIKDISQPVNTRKEFTGDEIDILSQKIASDRNFSASMGKLYRNSI